LVLTLVKYKLVLWETLNEVSLLLSVNIIL
jgi:hypothetical protein